MVSRKEDKLRKVISEVKEEFPQVQCRYIVHDFSKKDDKDVAKFDAELKSLYDNIGILINNVGIAEPQFAKCFIKLKPDPLSIAYEIMQVNINSMLLMTSLFLPRFVQRRKGAIVNLSSLVGIHAMRGMASYSATKAAVKQFSSSIRQESMDSNVFIQTVYPGFVKTSIIPNHLKSKLPSFLAPDFRPFTQYCVATLGHLPETHGCLVHRLESYLFSAIEYLPTQFSDRVLFRFGEIIQKGTMEHDKEQ